MKRYVLAALLSSLVAVTLAQSDADVLYKYLDAVLSRNGSELSPANVQAYKTKYWNSTTSSYDDWDKISKEHPLKVSWKSGRAFSVEMVGYPGASNL